MRVIAVIDQRAVAEKILRHLGLWNGTPLLAPARALSPPSAQNLRRVCQRAHKSCKTRLAFGENRHKIHFNDPDGKGILRLRAERQKQIPISNKIW